MNVATVMAGIRKSHERPPVQKEAVMATDIIAMLETLDRGTLRGIRDRAMLLVGYAGGLRRSEIVGLDLRADQTEDGRGSSDTTCPVAAVETWIKFAKLAHGPLFLRVTGQGKSVGSEHLNNKEIARLVKRTAMAAGIRGDLAEIKRQFKFSGHSLRAGLRCLPRSTSDMCRISWAMHPPR